MRIISGVYKGKIIQPPKHFNSRPTTDFAKESLFNILNNYVDFQEANVLDLFAGTGNISFEFLSRGVQQVTCVEINKKTIRHLEQLFSDETIKPKIRIIQADAFKFITCSELRYTIIFADPPFDLIGILKLPQIIMTNRELPSNAIIIIEHSSKIDFKEERGFFRTEKYGDVNFSFFKVSE
jgi:16S rRNA (guanine(966)-N(2))-methyltransferase RsmD